MAKGYTARITADLERQGARVRKTKKGILVQTDIGSYALHDTPSDHRSRANETAGLRRIGLEHPDVPRKVTTRPKRAAGEYPPYVTQNVSVKLLSQARQALYDAGWPLSIIAPDLRLNVSGMTKAKILYKLGYRYHPDLKKVGAAIVWVAPDEIAKLHEELENRRNVQVPDTRPVVTIDIPEPVEKPITYEEAIGRRSNPDRVKDQEGEREGSHEREFIDSVNSWVVNAPRNMTIEDYFNVLDATGLKYEIRVWREASGG